MIWDEYNDQQCSNEDCHRPLKTAREHNRGVCDECHQESQGDDDE